MRQAWSYGIMGALALGLGLSLGMREPHPEPVDVCAGPDADGDGIPDGVEGDSDVDGDGLANWEDDDSDGDGVDDAQERWANRMTCPVLVDCDFDGTPDYVDTDSDNDGVPDEEESRVGLRRCSPDSDDDGCGDLAEVAFGGCADAWRIGLAPGHDEEKSWAFDGHAVSAAFESVEGREPLPAGLVGQPRVQQAPSAGDADANADASANADETRRTEVQVRFTPGDAHEGMSRVAWLVLRDAEGRTTRHPIVIQLAKFGLI